MLLEHLESNLEHGRQSILLLNRRGHNSFVTCTHCGDSVTCPNCSISLTYHIRNNRLMVSDLPQQYPPSRRHRHPEG